MGKKINIFKSKQEIPAKDDSDDDMLEGIFGDEEQEDGYDDMVNEDGEVINTHGYHGPDAIVSAIKRDLGRSSDIDQILNRFK